MAHVTQEAWRATLARLRHLRAEGNLTTGHVRLAARGLGVGERTVWRRLARDAVHDADAASVRQGPEPYRLTETDIDAYSFYRGNVAFVHRARTAVINGSRATAGAPVPQFLIDGWADAQPLSLRALQYAYAVQLTPGIRAGLTVGEQGRRRHGVHLQRPGVARNHEWEMDHKQLPILVLPPRGPASKPWLTSIVDAGTRVLAGWCIGLYPSSATVLTALRMALVHDPERGPYGAVPALVRVDRGLEFAADAVKEALASLCVRDDVLPGYQPQMKGKIERINRTVEQTLLVGLPGYTHGSRDVAGRLYGPIRDDPAARAAAADAAGTRAGPWRIERLAARFADWVTWYNTERPHRMLDDRTPLQAWNDDPSALHRIPAETLRHLLLAGRDKIIQSDGVHHNSLTYIAPELRGRGGQRVGIRYMPHDDRWIEVYVDGRHLCTAYPQGQLSSEQADQFRQHAREEAAWLRRARRRATRNARTEVAPLTGDDTSGGSVEPSRLIPTGTQPVTAANRPPPSARQLATYARVDLLGLNEPTSIRANDRAPDNRESPHTSDEC